MKRRFLVTALFAGFLPVAIGAHSGPPFPLVSNRIVGPYTISIWTDPDTTDDGTAAGQFWVMVKTAQGSAVAAGTRAEVTASPDRNGETKRRSTEPVNGDLGNQFAAIVLDHEGPFAIHVTIDGPSGKAEVDTNVDATYDLRPPRAMIVLYIIPFLVVGFLWGKLLLQRRGGVRRTAR